MWGEKKKLKDSFVVHSIGGKTVHVPTAEALFHGLGEGNRTVRVILGCLTHDTTEDAMVDALEAEFIGGREEMAEDVRSVISKLRSIGAIED